MTTLTPIALPADRPLTSVEYLTLRERLESTYIRRASDQKVAKFLEEAIEDRKWWMANRNARPGLDIPTRTAEEAVPSGSEFAIETREGDFPTATPRKRFETRGAIITGESGAGKTRLLNGALARTFVPTPSNDRDVPMLFQQVPGPCTLLGLGREILDNLGYPVAPSTRENVVWELVRKHLALAGVQILHLDEIQNVLETANVLETRRILNSLKTLMNHPRHPVILLLSGLPEFATIAESDDQIQRRCLFTPLEMVGTAQASMLAKAVTELAARASLSVEADIAERIMPRLIHAGRGLVGLSMEIAVCAALEALRPRDKEGRHLPPEKTLRITHFAAEFAKRSGNAAIANPFLIDGWHLLDTSKRNITSQALLAQSLKQVSGPAPSRRRTKTRTRP